MSKVYAWLSERDGYVVATVSTVLGMLTAFGLELSAEQSFGITATVGALIALILGRPVKPVE